MSRVRPWHVAIVWAVLMLPLTRWGLPDRRHDAILFAGEPAWPVERYRAADALKERGSRVGGADTDLNPLVESTLAVELTESDAGVAEILRRYRLYSRQPDEMITFMALQRMKPRQLDFDPRLYQYGGAWVYLVGACIGAASLVGLTQISGDVGVYLERPEAFAAFYLVARLVTLAFAAGLLAAVARLGRMTGSRLAGWLAMLVVAASPVFISGALEAKPHVPSACMLLWSAVAAIRYHRHPTLRRAIALGVLSGLSAGFVLTGAAAIVTLAALAFIHACRADRRRTLARVYLAGAVALSAYAATNPYVILNAISNPDALQSNLGNSTAMYSLSRLGDGAARVGELLVESVGVGTLLLGAIGAGLMLRTRTTLSTIAAAGGVALLLLSAAIGAGKPAEFARFLVVPAALLAIAASAACARLFGRTRLGGFAAAIACALLSGAPAYVAAFVAEVRGSATRDFAATVLKERLAPPDRVGVFQEPAPYSIPPMDFVRRRVVLLPRASPASTQSASIPEWLVCTADDEKRLAAFGDWWHPHYARVELPARPQSVITWANKPVFLFRRID